MAPILRIENGYGSDPTFRDVTIKISGCTNSCGQHHIANIGFHGASKTVDEQVRLLGWQPFGVL